MPFLFRFPAPAAVVLLAVALSCGGSRVRLMFDIYHEEHVETRAPAGFTLAS